VSEEIGKPEDDSRNLEGDDDTSAPSPSALPSITVPQHGAAIRGIGEKFSANHAAGTGPMSVPIATTPGRAVLGHKLSLSYDSEVEGKIGSVSPQGLLGKFGDSAFGIAIEPRINALISPAIGQPNIENHGAATRGGFRSQVPARAASWVGCQQQRKQTVTTTQR
jgi:hypothetical protein